MNRQTKFSPELRERAIRMVYEQREHHEPQWAAIESGYRTQGAPEFDSSEAKTGFFENHPT